MGVVNKLPQIWWFNTTQIYYLVVLESEVCSGSHWAKIRAVFLSGASRENVSLPFPWTFHIPQPLPLPFSKLARGIFQSLTLTSPVRKRARDGVGPTGIMQAAPELSGKLRPPHPLPARGDEVKTGL